MLLHFVHVPADPVSPLVTRSVQLDGLKLSCDAAYFIPMLLRDTPPGFITGGSNASNGVIPYPTFNECLSDNVPLILYRAGEGGSRLENSRAKQLVQLFADKLARKQTSFLGDVLVFWRRTVDERRHQMKLTDFTAEDAHRLLGSSTLAENALLGTTGTTTQEAPSGSTAPAAPDYPDAAPVSLNEDVAKRKNGVSGSGGLPSEAHVAQDGQACKARATDLGEGSASLLASPDVKSERLASSALWPDGTAVSATHSFSSHRVKSSLPRYEASALSSSISGTSGSVLDGKKAPRTSSLGMDGASDQCALGQRDAGIGVADSACRRDGPAAAELNESLRVTESVSVLRSVIETFIQQLPLATAALDSIAHHACAVLASPPFGTKDSEKLAELRSLLVESQASDRMHSLDMVRASTEVERLAEANAQLVRENESYRQEVVAAQNRAQLCLEETAQLMQEIAVLREELKKREGTSRSAAGSATARDAFLEHPGLESSNAVSPKKVQCKAWNVTPVYNQVTSTTVTTSEHITAAERDLSGRRAHRTEASVSGASIVGAASGVGNTGLSVVEAQGSARVETALSSHGGIEAGGDATTDGNAINNLIASSAREHINGGRQWLVTQAYKPADTASNDKFADLAEGDLVTVEREDTSGWWWVSNRLTSGWYPFSFLQALE